jgi:exodeoxyribonuclease V alpha subunit
MDSRDPCSSPNRLVYSPRMKETEERVAARVLDLQAGKNRTVFSLKDADWEMLDELSPWGWDDLQKQVFLDAGTHGVTVITGGPGTGKTTLIRGLVRLFTDRGFEIALTAPTGRAARRMTDATGIEARTIHRLLEVAYDVKDDDTLRFRRNADFQLDAGVVIVDEASMLDMPLFDALLQACADGTRLVLVGDADQLPSVGAGRVLGDLIDSGRLPVTRLRQVFRQSDGSRIAANAQGILEGRFPEFSDEWGEFHMVRRYRAEAVAKAVVQLCHQEIPERYGFDPRTDIQVLTPMRRGTTGVANLNQRLREVLNPDGKVIGHAKNAVSGKAGYLSGKPDNENSMAKYQSGKPDNENSNANSPAAFVFREGDRVMQNRNDYQLPWTSTDGKGNPVSGEGVYNGDMGTITDYSPRSRTATVVFDDGRQAEYGHDRMDGLEPAYAVTVHKSQGSEYPVVVLPLFGLPDSLACRNLLYTAITRARRMVVIVGTETMLERMIRNNRNMERHSGLAVRLRQAGIEREEECVVNMKPRQGRL